MLATLIAISTIIGQIEATEARWSGSDTIVTESRVRRPDGSIARVVQLGGSIGGIGMVFSHVPAPLQAGQDVELVVTAGDRFVLMAARDGHSLLTARAEQATYGLQRTTRSGRPLYRAAEKIRFVYDAAGTSTIPEQLELAVLDEALAQWEVGIASCGRVAFDRAIEPGVQSTRDGVNTVHFRDDRWCRPATATDPEICYPAGSVAMTRVLFVDDPTDPDDGKIIEADIEINASGFALQVDGVPRSSSGTAMDLLSVVMHEVGHALGLAHTCTTEDELASTDIDGHAVPRCDQAGPDQLAATMFPAIAPGDTSKRSLEAADTDGVCATMQPLHDGVTGGCSSGGGDGHLAVLILVIYGAVAKRRR